MMGYRRAIFGFLCGLGLLYPPLAAQGVGSAIGGLEASPTRASPASVFWNPATLGASDSTEFEINLAMLGGWLIYDRRDRETGFQNLFSSSETTLLAPTPFVSISSPLGTDKFRFGYATYFPGGGVADYPADGSQRYELIDGYFVPWNHQFTVAYSPTPEWTFAGSMIYSVAFLKASLDIDLAPFISELLGGSQIGNENPALASNTRVNRGTAHAYTFTLGLLYRPNVQWSFGASFYFPTQHNFNSTMDIRIPRMVQALGATPIALGLEDNVTSRATFTFDSPPVLNLGLRYQPFGYWTGEYFGRYIFSSEARFMSIKFQSSPLAALEATQLPGGKARDSWMFGTTQSFQLWRPFTFGLTSFYGNSSVPSQDVSSSRVGFNQLAVGGFARYRWANSLRIGVEYAHYFLFDRNISESRELVDVVGVFDKPKPTGRYRAGLDRVGVSVYYAF